jgi:hypothetical protein
MIELSDYLANLELRLDRCLDHIMLGQCIFHFFSNIKWITKPPILTVFCCATKSETRRSHKLLLWISSDQSRVRNPTFSKRPSLTYRSRGSRLRTLKGQDFSQWDCQHSNVPTCEPVCRYTFWTSNLWASLQIVHFLDFQPVSQSAYTSWTVPVPTRDPVYWQFKSNSMTAWQNKWEEF